MFPHKFRLRLFCARIYGWFYWNFKATEAEKLDLDMFLYGTGIMKDGKRIDPKKFLHHPIIKE